MIGFGYLLSVSAGAASWDPVSHQKRVTALDWLITTLAFIGFSLPTFFHRIAADFDLQYSRLGWVPFIYSSTLVVSGLGQLSGSWCGSPFCLMLVLALFQTAILMRFIRTAIAEELSQGYVRTARAKGLSQISHL